MTPDAPQPESVGDPALSRLPVPTIHEAERESGPSGAILFGAEIAVEEAVARRQKGLDVVVRGNDTDANRKHAESIERRVGPTPLRQAPHRRAGPLALPHYQQEDQPPEGH